MSLLREHNILCHHLILCLHTGSRNLYHKFVAILCILQMNFHTMPPPSEFQFLAGAEICIFSTVSILDLEPPTFLIHCVPGTEWPGHEPDQSLHLVPMCRKFGTIGYVHFSIQVCLHGGLSRPP